MQFICAYLAWIYSDIEQWKIWCCCLHAQLGTSERSIQVGSLIWSSFCFGRAWNKLCHSRVDVRWCESYPLSQGLEPNSVCDVHINCFHFSHIKRDSSSSNLYTAGLPNPGFTLDCPNMSHGQNTEWLGRIPKRLINQSAMHGSPISTLAYTNFYWKHILWTSLFNTFLWPTYRLKVSIALTYVYVIIFVLQKSCQSPRCCCSLVAPGTDTVKGDKPAWSASKMPSTATKHRRTPWLSCFTSSRCHL